MKLLTRSMLFMLLTLSCLTGLAQKTDNRPTLFAAYPEKLNLDGYLINTTFNYTEGATVSVPFSAEFHFNGKVLSNEQVFKNLQTVMIRSEDNNTMFQISRITNDDKSITYTGRILNVKAADGYEIKSNNGAYFLQKFETRKIFEPCKL